MGSMETSTPADPRPPSAVGHLLRAWRATRGMSQLDLALRAGFSARHVSFIETGRSQPSRQALLVLAETLDVPLRQRNQLLEAGGYADAYRETPLDAEEMAAIRGMLRFILDRHAPYAAIVLDRYSTCVMGNAAADRLVDLVVDPSLVATAREPPAAGVPSARRAAVHRELGRGREPSARARRARAVGR